MMSGKAITRENVSPALAALLPVLDWIAQNNCMALVAIRIEASFGASLAKQEKMLGDAISGAPPEILSHFHAAWPLYVEEEGEMSQ
jgi:hypothetical protein